MKTKKTIQSLLILVLIMMCSFSVYKGFSQVKSDTNQEKDCCVMKDGKMLKMESGKTMLMEKEITMKNGTVCKPDGECITTDGQKIMMKEGDCMDMNGKVWPCEMKGTMMKSKMEKNKIEYSNVYACPMHPEIKSDKKGKCSKCGMDLELVK